MVKICPICRATLPNKQAMAAHLATHNRTRTTRSRRGRARGRGGNANNVLRAKEFYGGLKSGTVINLHPRKIGCAKLAAFTQMYELFKYTRLVIHFVSRSSTTTNGYYMAGVSYDKRSVQSEKAIAALYPVINKPIYQSSVLTVPCARLMGKPWIDCNDTEATGNICTYLSAADLSVNVWVEYTVVFSGPVSATDKDISYLYSLKDKKWRIDDTPVSELAVDYDWYGELEVQGGQQETEYSWATFQRLLRLSQYVSQYLVDTISRTTWVGTASRIALPALTAPAVLTVTRRPFRVPNAIWRELSGEGYNDTILDCPSEFSYCSEHYPDPAVKKKGRRKRKSKNRD